MATEQEYLEQNNKHELAYKCMQKDKRIKELEEEIREARKTFREGMDRIESKLGLKSRSIL